MNSRQRRRWSRQYPYVVKLDYYTVNSFNQDQARFWCAEQFGTRSFVVRTEITARDANGLFLGDRWYWATVYHFRRQEDAMMFSLRWL